MLSESLSQWTNLTGSASNQNGPFTRYPQNKFKEFGGHLALGFSLNHMNLAGVAGVCTSIIFCLSKCSQGLAKFKGGGK